MSQITDGRKSSVRGRKWAIGIALVLAAAVVVAIVATLASGGSGGGLY